MQTCLYRCVSDGGEGYKSYMLTGICEIYLSENTWQAE